MSETTNSSSSNESGLAVLIDQVTIETVVTQESSASEENIVQVERDKLNPASRPNYGSEGRPIALRSNLFRISMPSISIQHYHVEIFPDTSTSIRRELVNKLIAAYQAYFVNVFPIYDGRQCLYSRRPIPLASEKQVFEVQLPNDHRTFKITVSCLGGIDTVDYDRDIAENRPFISPKALYATDIILRHLAVAKYVPIGKSFFSPPGPDALGSSSVGSCDLGNGREMWFGYHQSVHPTEWNLMLNIDLSTTAFYRSQPVVGFLAAVLELPMQALSERTPISDAQRIRFTREIKSLRVEVTHCGKMRRRYRVCNVTRKSAFQQTFLFNADDNKVVETTVAKYFYHKYGLQLMYPHLPCLQVGHESKHIYLPLEVCVMAGGQRCHKRLNDQQTSVMIRGSHRTAPEREVEINHLLARTELVQDPFIQEYGISINPTMTEVQGRVLNSPKLLYGKNPVTRQYQTVVPNSGLWDMRGKLLHSGVQVSMWALVSFAPQQAVRETDLRRFSQELRRVATECGMPIMYQPCFCKYAAGAEQVEPMFKYIKSTFPGIQMIISVLPGKSSIYAEIKKTGDTVLGVPTQCIAYRNLLKTNPQMLSNIVLKMNVKMGGINTILMPHYRPRIFDEPVIFLGADISHATSGDTKRPAIAAIVGSMDAHPSRYAATVRLQQLNQEIIVEMADMVKDLLRRFRRSTGFRPMRIVMYRAAVSEGQYYNALQYELRAIRQACQMLETDYNPAITYIIVQKRHHTRLFAADPMDFSGRAHNVPAGTTVDVGIVHPSQFDFFLCSHSGIQGTSRPSRYHVMWDDSKMSADELQKLTFQLCHTYVRCTRAVSLPAPTYYAHLVAHRARYHLSDRTNQTESSFVESMYSAHSSDSRSSSLGAMEKAVEVHPYSSEVMYYA